MCLVAALGVLVVDLPFPRSFGLKALLLDVTINLIELMDESVELLLLLPEGSLVGVEAHLEPALALIFFLLVTGLLVPHHYRSMVVLP